MRFATEKGAAQNRGEAPFGRPRSGLSEPITGLKSASCPPQADIFTLGAAKYRNEPWYRQTLKGGWPGVKGEVKLGVPVVDKFGEVLVVYRNENGFVKSAVLGKAPEGGRR